MSPRTSPAAPARNVFAALALMAALSAARVACAQPISAENEREAVALAQRGVSARRAGRDDEALADFDRSLALSPRSSVRAQRGFALQALGRWVEAERALEEVARSDDAWVRQHRAAIDDALTTVRSHLAWLELAVDPARSEVLIDGAPASPRAPVRMPAGVVTVVVRCEGHYPVERPVTLRRGETARETIALRPRVEVAPPRSELTPAAALTATVASTPPVAPSSAAAQATAPIADAVASPRWIGPTALATAGAVSLGVGGALWAMRDGALRELSERGCVETDAEFVCDARSADVATARELHADASRDSVVSVVALVTGGALIAAGAAWMIVETLRRGPAHHRASVTVAPGGVRWTF